LIIQISPGAYIDITKAEAIIGSTIFIYGQGYESEISPETLITMWGRTKNTHKDLMG